MQYRNKFLLLLTATALLWSCENKPDALPTISATVSGVTTSEATFTLTVSSSEATSQIGVIYGTSSYLLSDTFVCYGSVSQTTQSVSDLNDNTTYYYKPFAMDLAGERVYGSTSSFTTEVAEALTLSPTEISAINAGGYYSFDITSNVTWVIEYDQSFFTLSPTSGYGNEHIIINMTANTTKEIRTAVITVTSASLSGTITVTQEANSENAGEGMILVEGGTFTMGATSEQGSDTYDDEKPTHKVTLSSFYIGKYEVTQREWSAVMGVNPSRYQGDGGDYPVEQVSWNDIVGTSGSVGYTINGISYLTDGFCYKLSQMRGGGVQYRLPTEAEWEYAARGGKQSKNYKYSGSNTVDDVAWYWDNCQENFNNGSTPYSAIGKKQANELGIFDMSGNVWEWCSDWYGSYSGDSQTNPIGPSSGLYRVIRGGGWSDYSMLMRLSYRGDGKTPTSRNDFIGFRLAFDAN
ncbi:MAG: SUMF1/EgtB/PvdO family nonheme iron enzyme [Tannerella sp.]|nr:SUMF1/EgtB/PvdO family nonheme iron enzyme [Tannerella sp.]